MKKQIKKNKKGPISTEDKIKILDKSTRQETQFGVILEHIDSKIDLLVEGHKALDKKIDKNHEEFKEFRDEANFKFDVITETLKSHSNTLNSHTDILNSHTETLNSHSNILNSHTETLNSHSNILKSHSDKFEVIFEELHLIRSEQVKREEFTLLEKRLMALEKKVAEKLK